MTPLVVFLVPFLLAAIDAQRLPNGYVPSEDTTATCPMPATKAIPLSCSVNGDPHYKTFGGCWHNFQGYNWYPLLTNRKLIVLAEETQDCNWADKSAPRSCSGPDLKNCFVNVGVTCMENFRLIYLSDEYANRVDHCDPSYGCTPEPALPEPSLDDMARVYGVTCNECTAAGCQKGCAVRRIWDARDANGQHKQTPIVYDPKIDLSLPAEFDGVLNQLTLERRDKNGVVFNLAARDRSCNGAQIGFDRYVFWINIDPACSSIRPGAGRAAVKSPLFDSTFGLCGFIDKNGRTVAGSLAKVGMDDVTFVTCPGTGAQNLPPCSTMRAIYNSYRTWGSCPEGTPIDECLFVDLAPSERCNTFDPFPRDSAPTTTLAYAPRQFRALDFSGIEPMLLLDVNAADVNGTDVGAAPELQCATKALFFGVYATCDRRLTPAAGMTSQEAADRNSALLLCVFDGCQAENIDSALSNTKQFQRAIESHPGLNDTQITLVVLGAIAGAGLLAFVAVLMYRRKIHAEHALALSKFNSDSNRAQYL